MREGELLSNKIRFDKEDLSLQDLPVENCTECDVSPATCYIQIDIRGAGFTSQLGDGRYCFKCGAEELERIQATMPSNQDETVY